jgi:hypothetical protein
MLLVRYILVSFVLVLLPEYLSCYALEIENELKPQIIEINGGFEKGDRDTPSSWARTSQIAGVSWEWSQRVSHSGKRGISVRASLVSQRASGWVSDFYRVIKRNIYVEGWVSTKKIVSGAKLWHTGMITVQFFGKTHNFIGHQDLVRISGDHKWRRYGSHMYLPRATVYIRLVLGLSRCIGEAWFDDLRIAELEDENSVYERIAENWSETPIIPKPLKIIYHSGNVIGKLKEVVNLTNLDISRITAEIGRIADSSSYKILHDCQTPIKNGGLRMIFCPPEMFEKIIGEKTGIEPYMTELGAEGYGISIQYIRNTPTILLSASNIIGFFNALQTLSQLKKMSASGACLLKKCSIADRPSLPLRAIATGFTSTDFLDKMKALKFNKIIIHSLPGGREKWNQPLSEEEKGRVRDIIRNCLNRFIIPNVVIWPGGYGKAMRWTSNEDRLSILSKILAYRELGIKEFTLFCPSDYMRVGKGNGIVYEEDKHVYKDVASAHFALIDYLSGEISKAAPEIKLYLYPFYYYGLSYYGSKEIDYLRKMGELPKQVNFVYSGEMNDGAFIYYKSIIKRNPTYRSVYFSKYEKDRPRAVYPFMWDASAKITQHIEEFVMETPFTDMMFYMASDYAWNASRYKRIDSAIQAYRKISLK